MSITEADIVVGGTYRAKRRIIRRRGGSEMKTYGYEVWYSPDDGGHYATVVDKGGKDVYTSPIFPTAGEAVRHIMAKYAPAHWIRIGE